MWPGSWCLLLVSFWITGAMFSPLEHDKDQMALITWDLAVAIDNQINLLRSNGTSVDIRDQPFTSLKALTYDNVRDQFIVSDMRNGNDTVYTVQIKRDVTVPIIQGLRGDVQGLAVDPINDMLYWTDGISPAINYVPLNESFSESRKILLKDTIPHTLAIDVCKRYIYWTNPAEVPTIERAKLDGSGQEIFIDHLLMTPEGLAIDYKAQRLYWADSRIGTVAGRIETVSLLDGQDRQTVIEKNTMQPYGLAVDESAIYFTDTNNYALYKIPKDRKGDEHREINNEAPEKLIEFKSMPMGLVAYNNIIKEEPDCIELQRAIETYKEFNQDDSSSLNHESFHPQPSEVSIKECFNGGELLEDSCKCPRGFSGSHCENSMCQNLCLNGDCYLSSLGKAMCRCDRGFGGDRCQRNLCDGFCLNGGKCGFGVSRDRPRCRCQDGFLGDRCELEGGMCDVYCADDGSVFYSEVFESLCRCNEGPNRSKSIRKNETASALNSLSSNSNSNDLLNKLNDPIIYLSVLVLFSCVVIISLIIYIRMIRKRRPRIKKRIIVNKNVTPLTYRPQQPATSQCEITIENCCNMNVCETPCFEPRGEDKKKLLTNMEGEDY